MISVRPRVVDINKPIMVVFEDNVEGKRVSYKRRASQPKKEKEEEEEVKKWEEPQETAGDKIPIPGCRIVPDYDTSQYGLVPFARERTYIIPPEGHQEKLDYDMDDEDEEFLNQLNTGDFNISNAKFEEIVTTFEIEARDLDHLPSQQFFENYLEDLPSEVLKKIYTYWSGRRSLEGPLIPYLKYKATNEFSPFAVFRPYLPSHPKRKQKRETPRMEEYNRLLQLRYELERARILLEMVRKREQLKQSRIAVLSSFLEKVDSIPPEAEEASPGFIKVEEESQNLTCAEDNQKRSTRRKRKSEGKTPDSSRKQKATSIESPSESGSSSMKKRVIFGDDEIVKEDEEPLGDTVSSHKVIAKSKRRLASNASR